MRHLKYLCALGLLMGGKVESFPLSLGVENHPSSLFLESGKDLLVFKNQTKTLGVLQNIPSLLFSFGAVNFSKEEVAYLLFFKQQEQQKLQVITCDGRHYSARLQKEPLYFEVNGKIEKINLEDVSFLILNTKEKATVNTFNQLFSVSLKNGDVFTASWSKTPLNVSNGWQQFLIDPKQILELTLEGEKRGKLLSEGEVRFFNISSIEEPFFVFYLPKTFHFVHLPWDLIASLQTLSPQEKKVLEKELLVLSRQAVFQNQKLFSSSALKGAKGSVIALNQSPLLEKHQGDVLKQKESDVAFSFFGSGKGGDLDLKEKKPSDSDEEDPFPKENYQFLDEVDFVQILEEDFTTHIV